MIEFTTDTGRLVWGHPMNMRQKKHQDGPMKGQVVMKDGKAVEQCSFGVAYPKQYFDQHIRPWLMQEAATGFPNGTPQGFAWKITDGDGIDKEGKPFNQREGYAGCYVLAFSTESFAPNVVKRLENGSFQPLNKEEIKCGDYIAVSLSAKLNIPTDRSRSPSLYINPKGVLWVAYGQEIQSSGFDAGEAFGNNQFTMPPGASMMPQTTLPQNMQMPGGGQQQQFTQQPVQQQQFQQQPGYQNGPQQMQGYGPQAGPMGQSAPAAMPQQGMQQQYGVNQPQHAGNVLPSNQLPPPDHNFVNQAMGQQPQQFQQQPGYQNGPQPVQPQYTAQTAGMSQQGMPQAGNPTAMPATSYPSNQPGMQQQQFYPQR